MTQVVKTTRRIKVFLNIKDKINLKKY